MPPAGAAAAPHPLGPATCVPLAGVAAARPTPQDAGLGCGRREGLFVFIAAAPGPQLPRRSHFLIPLLSIARQSSFQQQPAQSYPKRAFLGLPADAAPAPAGEQREPRDASLPLQGRPAGSAAPVSAPQDAAPKFVRVYA